MNRIATAALLATLAMGLSMPSPRAMAAAAPHDHGHAASAAALQAGQRWASDAPLRQGMGKIRGALQAKLEAVHHDTLADEQYKPLADTTQQQLAYIVSHCKLKPEADAALHGIIGRMSQAADAMAGKSEVKPRAGAMLLADALDEYGKTFEHPGWKPLH